MTNQLEGDPGAAIALARASHERLLAAASTLTDEQLRAPSRLPGWTVGHVLTHLARNAEGHARRLEGALRGEDEPRYPGGMEQRDGDIASGSTRSSSEIVEDVDATNRRLEEVWDRCSSAGWPHADLLGGDYWPITESPVRRLREVEMHHVDLGIGYEPTEWPDAYVDWELPQILSTLPDRVARQADRRDLVAWLSGRRTDPPDPSLESW